ncbi:ribonuclease III [Aliifodinibius salipaludis]|uniref:Ribonuclease 3 n=1 Tax=Fodinibius salipaludis TaxID=2032627 RepID=A0A2A2G780_9BACT|nr:ribonuclease III [Aliifodinibius salipaludis]PAU92864.1 ribonuclease III [Aliifodinibius salipaludis]
MFDKLRSYFQTDEELPPEQEERIKKLEGIIGNSIDNPFIYIRALRHRSTLADEKYSSIDSYERLEFLGDAVLDLIVTEIIFDLFPNENEGFLTKLRAKLVKGDTLAMYAEKLKLNNLMLLGKRVRGQGIEESKSVLSDLFEALVGALYLDLGYEPTSKFVRKVIEQYVDFDQIVNTLDNYKSLLLEFAQAEQMKIPTYTVVSEEGPGHDKTFGVEVYVDEKPIAQGEGKSKKEAEQEAARKALKMLK